MDVVCDWRTIRANPSHGVEVVVQRFGQDVPGEAELLELAIHAHLLKRLQPNTRFIGIIECYEPQMLSYTFTEGELNALFQERVAPLLAELPAMAARKISKMGNNRAID